MDFQTNTGPGEEVETCNDLKFWNRNFSRIFLWNFKLFLIFDWCVGSYEVQSLPQVMSTQGQGLTSLILFLEGKFRDNISLTCRSTFTSRPLHFTICRFAQVLSWLKMSKHFHKDCTFSSISNLFAKWKVRSRLWNGASIWT